MHAISPAARRVVVTGLGVISPIGCDVHDFWCGLTAGRSGVARSANAASGRETDDFWGGRCAFSGRIEDFGELESSARRVIRKSLKLMNRETQLGVAAGQQALRDCGILTTDSDRERFGVCFGAGNVSLQPQDFLSGVDACGGTNAFDHSRWGRDGIPQVEPLWLLRCLPNMPSCHIAIINDLRGPNNCITQREAAANLAVAEAARVIVDDEADAMLVGGTGTLLQPVNHLHESLEHAADRPSKCETVACRPFDLHRGTMIPAEGAAAVVLEEREAAIQRGAVIYGELVGSASSCVIDRHGRPNARLAVANTIRALLSDANAATSEIDHFHAHGLGTEHSDAAEAQAIRDVFGDRTDSLPVTAAKSNMGNCGAGGGAIELVASLLAMRHGHLFPVLNFSESDPRCPVNPVTSATADAGDCFVNLSLHHRGLASGVMIRRAA